MGWDIYGLRRENGLAGRALSGWGLACFAAFAAGLHDFKVTHVLCDNGPVEHGYEGPRFVILPIFCEHPVRTATIRLEP